MAKSGHRSRDDEKFTSSFRASFLSQSAAAATKKRRAHDNAVHVGA
jgi:hypothetical protein